MTECSKNKKNVDFFFYQYGNYLELFNINKSF